MKLIGNTSRGALLMVLALGLGGLIAACGSASSSSGSASATSSTTTTASAAGGAGANSSRRAALAACLKQHGVTLPARPPGAPGGAGGSSGGGSTTSGTGTTGTGTTPRRGFFGGGGFAANPKVRSALQACGARFGFGGGRFRGRLSHTAITKYVTCVRQHGYNLPNPNFSGEGPVFPANIRTNAKFQAASRACQSLLAPPRGTGSGSAGGTSTTAGA
ncbi:MAG: hypothetical protein JO262_01830 [Solirubrobacterales bacterium]|nr:hypothetical protein [Solirubrobacterales bacterium]